MKGELENRDKEELGLSDLPEGLSYERGELITNQALERTLPPDMLRSAGMREDARHAGIGGPISDYTVRGIFDSRPINGYDFIQPVVYTVTATPIQVTLPILQVPAGRVIVLRAIDFSEPYMAGQILPDTLDIADLDVKILRNQGVVSPLYMNLALPPASITYPGSIPVKGPATLDTFLIFDENETIGLSIVTHDLLENTSINIIFSGNLLLKTGIPAPLEVANKGAGKPVKVVATQEDLAAVSKRPEVSARQSRYVTRRTVQALARLQGKR